MLGGPVVKDRTFFFADYQGQRQTHRTNGHVHRADGAAAAGHLHRSDRRARTRHLRSVNDRRLDPLAVSRQHDSRSAMDPVALALARALPAADLAGTANNYSRTANEINDQEQGDVRLDHKFASGRDQAFGRLTYFRDHAMPVTAFRRQRHHSSRQHGGRSAGHEGVGVRLELSAHVLGQPAERGAHRRHAPQRRTTAVQLPSPAGAALEHSRASPPPRSSPTRCRPSRRTATSSSGRR